MPRIFKTTLGGLGTLLAWELVVRIGEFDQSLFPSASQVLLRLIELVGQGEFLLDVAASMQRLTMGVIFGTSSALAMATLIIWSPWLKEILTAPIFFLYPVPKVALFPFFLLIFGLGWASQTALISVGVFFLVFINLQSGLARLMQSGLRSVLAVHRVPSHKVFFHYYMKGCWLDFLTGLRAALGYGLTLMVVSEISGSTDGLGHFIWRSWDMFRITDLFCGVFVIGVVGLSLNSIIDALIARTLPRYAFS